ncbi:MAG: hypothetical protein ACHQ53_12030 [Polyangiales bacterium]
MSEEIFSVQTQFADVVSLAQGYMNRADGERLLLPLPVAFSQGMGVRFVVFLADGTPAFAGAGLCVQASDQGSGVPAAQRYESLLDTLQFDERSRPVYEYIVAVRNAAYAQEQPADAAEEPIEEAAALLDVAGTDGASLQPEPWTSEPAQGDSFAPVDLEPESSSGQPGARQPSFVPPPLPTGLLSRPALSTHWQPLPPRRPTPRPASGHFRYGNAGLPRPARPPYPDLDPSQWVQPAPRPS